MAVFWAGAPCSLTEVYDFSEAVAASIVRAMRKKRRGAPIQKMDILIHTASKTRNLTRLFCYLMRFYQLHKTYAVEL
jgi:hypothetical protein